MPHSAKKRLPDNANRRRINKVLASLTADDLQRMIQLHGPETMLDPAQVSQFDSVMAQHGHDIYRAFQLMASCRVYSSRFQRFVPTGESDDWETDEVRCALPSFGFNSLERIQDELKAMAAESLLPGAVCVLLYVTPVDDDMPYLQLALAGDAQGAMAVGFGVEGKWRWTSPDLPPVRLMFSALCERDRILGDDFFDVAAAKLVAALGKRSDAGMPLRGLDQEKFLRQWLQREMREVGNLETCSAGQLAAAFSQALARMHQASSEAVERKTVELGKLHTKQAKNLMSRVEKAEMLAKGSQARAERLEAELRMVRQQSRVLDPEPTAPVAGSLGDALDRLFG